MTSDLARAAFLALLLAVEKVNGAGRRLPCQTRPADWYDDATPAARASAAEACGYCPLLHPCASYADAAGERHHVWGGRDRSTRTTTTYRKKNAA